MLVSRGNNTAPVWQTNSIEKAASLGMTYINSVSFINVSGLTKTITLTAESMVFVSTYGSLESDGSTSTNSSAEVQVFFKFFCRFRNEDKY